MNISVIIPVYNAEAFLKKAVQSALRLDEVKEILLIEDASPDHSLEICRELVSEHDKVKLFQHPDKGNHGAGASRNLGLEKASQEFVAFLDADDYYLPNRFETDREIFKNPHIDGSFNAIGTEFLTEKGKTEFEKKFKDTSLTTVKKHSEGRDVFYGLLGLKEDFGTFFHLNGLTVRKESITKNNLKFNEKLRVHQDSDFIIKLAYHCHLKSGNITEAVAVRGVHDDNRITKIQHYSEKYNQRQFQLWDSVFQWSKDKDLPGRFRNHIFLKRKSFELSLKKGWKKYVLLFLTAFFKPEILKTRYRFTILKR